MTKKDKQEMLLCSFYDGQSGYFGKLRARRLLARSPEAREYFEQLKKISSTSSLCFGSGSSAGETSINEPDMWEQISQRIEQEERAAFYLGSRELNVASRSSESKQPAFLSTLSAGFAGTMAVAAMAMFLFLPTSEVSVSGDTRSSDFVSDMTRSQQELASNSSVSFRDQSEEGVNFVSHERAEPLRITENRLNRAMEVDWMRSQGRVRLIQSPSERSAIIWIKRDQPEQVVVEDDESQIRIINDRVPTTRSAFGE